MGSDVWRRLNEIRGGEKGGIFTSSRARVVCVECMEHAGNKRYGWQGKIKTVRSRKCDTGL